MASNAPIPPSDPIKLPPKPAPQPAPQPQPHPAILTDPAVEMSPAIVVPLNFWQQSWVQNLLPLCTSLAVHIGIVVVALVFFKTVETVYKQVVQEQIIVPDATLVEGTEPGGIPNPGLGGDPNREAAQDKYPDASATSDGWADKPSKTLTDALMGGGSGDTQSSSAMIGLGAGAGAGTGTGFGEGSGLGSGTGDGSGKLAKFGVPGGGGGIGPKFMGTGGGGNVRNLAYVCDASGSMMNKMATLKNELKRSIDALRVTQSFSVIFFADEKPQALGQQLIFASPENKRKAYDFLQNITTSGATDPIPGLELAFRQKPQLIFLLTDGDFPDNAAVLKKVSELNKGKQVRINTIAFVGSGDTDKAFIEVLSQIAKESGGVFRQVSENEVP